MYRHLGMQNLQHSQYLTFFFLYEKKERASVNECVDHEWLYSAIAIEIITIMNWLNENIYGLENAWFGYTKM